MFQFSAGLYCTYNRTFVLLAPICIAVLLHHVACDTHLAVCPRIAIFFLVLNPRDMSHLPSHLEYNGMPYFLGQVDLIEDGWAMKIAGT